MVIQNVGLRLSRVTQITPTGAITAGGQQLSASFGLGTSEQVQAAGQARSHSWCGCSSLTQWRSEDLEGEGTEGFQAAGQRLYWSHCSWANVPWDWGEACANMPSAQQGNPKTLHRGTAEEGCCAGRKREAVAV